MIIEIDFNNNNLGRQGLPGAQRAPAIKNEADRIGYNSSVRAGPISLLEVFCGSLEACIL
jgi:hypothetical protein